MKCPPLTVVAGFALGLLSLLIGAPAGVPAFCLSLTGLRAVNESDGKVAGARLAVAGLVLGGIGTLVTTVGLVALAVLLMESPSHRAGCMNNYRLIGTALNEYADAHGTFPPATRDPAKLPPERRLSWMVDLLPKLGEGTRANETYRALAQKIDATAAWDDPANAAARAASVRPFLCPGHPNYRPNASPGLTTYVGLAGDGADAARMSRDDKRAGVFGHDRGIKPDEAQAGVGYTLAVAETAADNGPWIAGGTPTVRGVPDGDGLIGPGRAFGGMHRGLMYALWIDGSVREFNDNTPGPFLRRLARLRGRE